MPSCYGKMKVLILAVDNKIAIIAGASGLIGSHLLQLLLESNYSSVISVARKKLDVDHQKLIQKVVNFEELYTLENELKGDDVYCCLGSTIKKAGSKEKFLLFDYTYPVELATITLTNGASQFHIVSSLGANRKSWFFYNRVKGEVEEAIAKMDFKSIHIYRPSLLLGKRNELRFGEKMGEYFSYLLYPMFRLFRNYQPVQAAKVAKAMVAMAAQNEKGVYFHPSKEIQAF